MKTILKRGTKEVVTCHTCGCVFCYDKEDIVKDSTPRICVKEYVSCPQCENQIILKQIQLVR